MILKHFKLIEAIGLALVLFAAISSAVTVEKAQQFSQTVQYKIAIQHAEVSAVGIQFLVKEIHNNGDAESIKKAADMLGQAYKNFRDIDSAFEVFKENASVYTFIKIILASCGATMIIVAKVFEWICTAKPRW